MKRLLVLLTMVLLTMVLAAPLLQAETKPNIVYIICDDLGYGDVYCLAPETSKIPTPHADRRAGRGHRLGCGTPKGDL